MRTLSSFGADPALPDNSSFLQAALNYGGEIEIDPVSFTFQAGVTATKPVQLIGEKTQSVFLCGSSFAANIPLIQVSPNMTYGSDGYVFKDFQIAPAVAGVKAASIFFNTSATGQFLRKPIIDGLTISQMADQCIVSANNNADGLASLKITDCILMGGIFLQSVGDSLVIEDNVISGTGIGVYSTFAAGAACAFVGENNITSKGGAIYLVGGAAPILECNNIESVVYGYNGGVNALVFLQNIYSASLVGNNVNAGNTADCIRTIGCYRSYYDVGFLQVATGRKHITRDAVNGSIIGPTISFLDSTTNTYGAGYIT